MRNLNPRYVAWSLGAVFLVCFTVVAIFEGGPFTLWSVAEIAFKAISGVSLVVTIFCIYAWRWKFFQHWLVPFPDLNGTWEGTLQTTWTNPDTGALPGPIPVMLTIRQSFVRINCVMRTAEMVSRSYISDFWIQQGDQIRFLSYNYRSEPKPSVRGRSAPHDGSAVLEIIGDPVRRLIGKYWSDRKTTGEITLQFRCRNRLQELPEDFGPHPVSGRK